MFVDSEGIIKTWKKLKTVLLDKFLDEMNSTQVRDAD